MFTARFDRPTRIDAETALRGAFGCDRLYLAAGGAVTFSGTITVGPDVSFAGECHVADGTRIDNGAILTDVRLGRSNAVRAYSVMTAVRAGDRNLFGPFCFIRDNCEVGDECILGAHVEAARSRFGSGTRISHRAFVGDAEIGENTIIGAGVVFCNYDGQGRQKTTVGPGVTVGSGSLLVPPLAIGAGAMVAAGSTVTKDLPAGSKLIQKR
jgi:bifunctional UDP-N-acetylglucosamine pyrophosphorylase/glucosamine-1-phosphate N-acetyltransferase